MTEGLRCPCCGTAMEEKDEGSKLMVRCPSCGLAEPRLRT